MAARWSRGRFFPPCPSPRAPTRHLAHPRLPSGAILPGGKEVTFRDVQCSMQSTTWMLNLTVAAPPSLHAASLCDQFKSQLLFMQLNGCRSCVCGVHVIPGVYGCMLADTQYTFLSLSAVTRHVATTPLRSIRL